MSITTPLNYNNLNNRNYDQPTFAVVVPANVQPGAVFTADVGGYTTQLVCPDDAKAGDTIQVQQPKAENKRYDVSNTCERVCGYFPCCCIGPTTRILELEDEEAVLSVSNNCLKKTQRRPYAQLGSIDKINSCGCCWMIGSDLSESAGKEGPQPISPGCGCEEALVNEIVEQLQSRKVSRGNIGQMKQQETMQVKIDELTAGQAAIHGKLDLILERMQLMQHGESSMEK